MAAPCCGQLEMSRFHISLDLRRHKFLCMALEDIRRANAKQLNSMPVHSGAAVHMALHSCFQRATFRVDQKPTPNSRNDQASTVNVLHPLLLHHHHHHLLLLRNLAGCVAVLKFFSLRHHIVTVPAVTRWSATRSAGSAIYLKL